MNNTFCAPVIHGRRLGRKLGFPTINQTPPESFAILPRGVWFSRCEIDGVSYPAVSNLGIKPTVQSDGELICETYIFMDARELYGLHVTTTLIQFRRGEVRFESVDELAKMLAADIAAAKEYFGLC